MGNAFILKPSEMTPTYIHADCRHYGDAGLPKGLMNVIHGDYRMGQAICSHPGITGISQAEQILAAS